MSQGIRLRWNAAVSVAARRLALASLAGLVLTFASGCIPTVAYTRDDEAVARLGVEAAQKELSDILYSAAAPQVTAVEFTDDMVKISYNQPVFGPYGVVVSATPLSYPLTYHRIQRIEVYENNKIFIYGPSGTVEREILFNTLEDARRCAQLLLAFKAQTGTPAPANAGQPGT